jgi:hypothetical protein
VAAAQAVDFLQREMRVAVCVEEAWLHPLQETLAGMRSGGGGGGRLRAQREGEAPPPPLEVFVPPRVSRSVLSHTNSYSYSLKCLPRRARLRQHCKLRKRLD